MIESADLLLRIKSKPFEVECDKCVHGMIPGSDGAGHKCDKCHGSGKRTVRLVGDVPIERKGTLMNVPNTNISQPYESQLLDRLIQAYHDNTLPDEIKNCLELVPVEEAE